MAPGAEIERELSRDALSCLICERPGPALDYDHIQERSLRPDLARGSTSKVNNRPCPVNVHVTRATESYEVALGMCAVCKEPLANRNDVVDGEYASLGAAQSATIFITVKSDAPSNDPALAVESRLLGMTAAGGVQAAIDEVADGATVESATDGSAISPSGDGVSAHTASQDALLVEPSIGALQGTEPALADEGRGNASRSELLTTSVAGGQAKSSLANDVGAEDAAKALSATTPFVTTSLHCAKCFVAGFTVTVDEIHVSPIISNPSSNIAPLCRPCHHLKSIKRIKTWTMPHGGKLRYYWTLPGNTVEMRSRAVYVDERYGCLRPIEEESHAAQ